MNTPYTLVDWGWLLRQIPWVLGLAVGLAGLSWGHWEALTSRRRHREVLSQPGYHLVFSLSLMLLCTGLALNPQRWWETYLWAAFGGYFVVDAVLVARALYRGKTRGSS